ncbi:CheR family methyltransferase [Falsirhodobacter sp. 20TX0035]|uniref:CheR family methyltransferase n=1 Tax=Falsirhodobacter sp. 20TX0035 TaxID=3022019 RepID=UPI00232ADE34|nr:CheR family methyltransferase [Falsirhodobacter sp. 20TX0035]MDB6454914.1 chemotaxis protein CheB [Falsirhodobacter sp. 20TX0035]
MPDPAPKTELPVVVGIGASAGGLEALREMLAAAHRPSQMCFVIVQHLDPTHESMMAQLLDRHTELDVHQAEGGEWVAADKVFIIPPGRGLAIQNGRLELTDFIQPRGLRRPIDDFFISLANDRNARAACVILSGTGADGSTGLRAIKENGGICIAQTPETAKYDGMPLSAVATGLVDYVKDPAAIVECLQGFYARKGDGEDTQAEVVADHVDELCKTLRTVIGHDFSGYKRSTLIRRVERRMHVLGIDTGHTYLQRVKTDRNECSALFRDLLINVTRFFRDPEAFASLQAHALAPLLDSRPADDELRIWVAGCSSGEEAYSIAMLLADMMRQRGEVFAVQIFATDIDEQMLQIAREGRYPLSAIADIPGALRERYTTPHADHFTINADIRDAIRFSSHSVVKDPPFSKVDLVSCRNLLIYFDDKLQQAVMPLFHYAIRPEGFLFLGPSESIGRFESLFPAVDQQARLFQRSPGAPVYPIDLPGSHRGPAPIGRTEPGRPPRRGNIEEGAAARRLIERYAPASMVLDQDAGILAAYGRLGPYFDFPVTRTGGSSAITLARPGLRKIIGPLLRQARDTRRRSVARDVEVTTEFGTQPVHVICDPLPDGTTLLVITETGTFTPERSTDLAELQHSDDNLDALEDELRLTRHRLRSAVEELETANEELKSSNEEMMSMNEELQSTNEELATVNDELKTKVDQLTVANSDLRNFFASTDLAVVVLDGRLNIRSYTESARAIFPLQPTDQGRPLADVATRLNDDGYLEDAQAIVDGSSGKLRRVRNRAGDQSFSLRTLPYRLQNGTVDGVTLVFTDISEALELERNLAEARDWRDLAVKAAGIGVWEYLVEQETFIFDETEQALFSAGPEADVEDILDRVVVQEDQAMVRSLLADSAATGEDLEVNFRINGPDGGIRWIKGLGRRIPGNGPVRLVGVSVDITAEYSLAETRQMMVREMNHRVKNLFAIIGSMIMGQSKSQTDVRDFALSVRERISALGRTHSLATSDGAGEAIDFAAIVRTTIAPYKDHATIRVEGPTLLVRPGCLSPLSMTLHEWATNAAKYGALRKSTGQLDVTWARSDDGVELLWRESFDTAETSPGKAGFGTRLVEMSVRQLGGHLEQVVTESRVERTCTLPGDVFDHDQ